MQSVLLEYFIVLFSKKLFSFARNVLKMVDTKEQALKQESLSTLQTPGISNKNELYLTRTSKSVSETPIINELVFIAAVEHYQKLIENIQTDEEMRSLSIEIATLLRKFREVFFSQQKFVQKVRELTSEVEIRKGEGKDQKQLLRDKNKLIDSLKKDLDKALQSSVDDLNLKNEALEELQRCKKEFQYQQMKALEAAEKRSTDDSSLTVERQIIKLREEMNDERESLQSKISELAKELASKRDDICILKKELEDSKSSFSETQDKLANVNQQLRLKERNLEKVEIQLTEAEHFLKAKENIINKLNSELQSAKFEIETLEARSKQLMEDNYSIVKNMNSLTQSFGLLKKEFDVRGEKLQTLKENLEKLQREFKNYQVEIRRLKKEIVSSNKAKFNAAKRMTALEHLKSQMDEKLQIMKQGEITAGKSLDNKIKKLREEQKLNQVFQKEVEVLNIKLTNFESTITQITHEMKLNDDAKRILKHKLEDVTSDLEKEKMHAEEVNTEKEKANQEGQRFKFQYNEVKSKVVFYELNLNKSLKQTSEIERKCNVEISRHLQTKDDFSDCKKALDISEEERKKLKAKVASGAIYIEQLKDGARNQVAELSSLIKTKFKLEREIILLKGILEKEKLSSRLLKSEIYEKTEKINFLTKENALAEKNQAGVKKDLDRKTETINILRTAIIAKTAEMDLLYQKFKLIKMTNSRGENIYNQRLDDIKLLKSELSEKSCSLGCLEKKLCMFNQIKQELIHAQEELVNEKLRMQAMEEDIKNPTNMHRWRVLEGKDPESSQLRTKIQFLQKKLMKNSSAMAQKDAELHESQELVKVLERQLQKKDINANTVNDILVYRSKYQHQKDKCYSLTSQVNMFFSQNSNYKEEIKSLKEELGRLKRADYLKKLNSQKRSYLKPGEV